MTLETLQKVREHVALLALAEVAPDGIRKFWTTTLSLQLGPVFAGLLLVGSAIWAAVRLSNRIAAQVRRVNDLSNKVDEIYEVVVGHREGP